MFRFFEHATPIYILWIMSFLFVIYTAFAHGKNSIVHIMRSFLIGLLPSAFILCLTPFIFDARIHPIITAATGFFFIIFGALLLFQYHTIHHITEKPLKKINRWHKTIFLFIGIFIIFFGIRDLGHAFYVDEKLWIYDRIETYWDNFLDGDWINTRPSDKPGVTTAIVSGPGLLFFDPSNFNEGTLHKDQLPRLFFALRLPALLCIISLLLLALYLSRKLFTPNTTVLFMIFLCLSPLLIGIARMINPDALLWIFFLISFLAFFHHLFSRSLPSLYIAGIFLGLALLTKYIANIFLVFYFFIILLDPILRKEQYVDIASSLREQIVRFGIMIGIALSVFYIFYPGAWVKHDRILLATIHSEAFASTWVYFAICICILLIDIFFNRARISSAIISYLHSYAHMIIRGIMILFSFFLLLVLYNTYTDMSIIDFMMIIESPKSIYRDVGPLALFSTSFYPLAFGVTPIVLLGAFIGIYCTLCSKISVMERMIILYSVLFILMFYAGSIVNHVMPIVRYQIVLYPLMIMIASVGWSFLLDHIAPAKFTIVVSMIFLTCEITQLFVLHGHYFSYNSPLLPQKYIINSKDMGDGNYEIAQYLNALPHAQDLLVWTDKTGLCQFFVGSCNNMIQDLALVDIAPQIDYYVVSQNRQGYITRLTAEKRANRPDYPLALDRLYDQDNPRVLEILPGGRSAQFIRIIPAHAVNIID